MSRLISKSIIGKIKTLRQQGWSLPEIKNETKVGYGTVYRYIKDVEILPEHKASWFGKRGGSKKRKNLAEKYALNKAQSAISDLSDKERLLILTALYWGEGSKTDFGLSNTDPELIKIFIGGLRKIFKIKETEFRVSIRIYEDLDKDTCLDYWSEITGIPKNKFVSATIIKGKKRGKLPYGMCRIRVRKGGNVLKYIVAAKKQMVRLFFEE